MFHKAKLQFPSVTEKGSAQTSEFWAVCTKEHCLLIHFMPLILLYTLKTSETSGFMFSGGIEQDQWHEMG